MLLEKTEPAVSSADETEPLLSARDLTTAYRGLIAISGISLDVRAGEIVTVAGANGAGTWRGTGSTGACTGRWEAERR